MIMIFSIAMRFLKLIGDLLWTLSIELLLLLTRKSLLRIRERKKRRLSTNKNNEFIYTIRIPAERDRIEQITTKNFNQNAYLDKVDRENKFWLLQGGKVCRSVNWVYHYYMSFDHGLSLDDKIPYLSK